MNTGTMPCQMMAQTSNNRSVSCRLNCNIILKKSWSEIVFTSGTRAPLVYAVNPAVWCWGSASGSATTERTKREARIWKEIYVWIKRKLKKNSFEVFKSKKSSKKIHDTHQRGKIKYEFRNLEALLAPKKDNELEKLNEISKYTNYIVQIRLANDQFNFKN